MAFVLYTRPSVVVGVLAVALCAAVVVSSSAATAACNGFALTPGQIGGTHFKASPVRHSVLGPGIHGTRITLSGYVLTSGCRAVRGARVDFWQADESGVYDDKGVRLRGHQFTDVRGRYWLQTILPGPYANRTRHLHVTVRARGGAGGHDDALFPRRGTERARSVHRPAPQSCGFGSRSTASWRDSTSSWAASE